MSTPRRPARIASIAALLFFGIEPGVQADPSASPPPVAAVDAARLDAAVARGTSGGPGSARGVSVAIVDRGRIVYTGTHGLADIAATRAVTAQTRFRIGSITKMFTAVSVMQLVAAGRIALDTPLATYAPDLPHAHDVTVRQLLMHTAGIPNLLDDALTTGRVADPLTAHDIVALAAAKPLAFRPGSRFGYSNTGYMMLGLLIERVTGSGLAAYERTHIFDPAGMTATTFEAAAGDASSLATGYGDASGTPAQPYSAGWVYACGDAISTATDLARFDIALMNGTLLSPPTFAHMYDAPVAMHELKAAYGLGLMLTQVGSARFVGHHGGVPGFESDNEMIPADGFATIVLGNAFTFSTAHVNAELVTAFYPQLRQAAEAPPMPTHEDPAITARFRQFLTGVLAGSIDRTTLSSTMASALTPAAIAQMRDQFTAAGTVTSIALQKSDVAGDFRRYFYRVTFEHQQSTLLFVLDSADKISGFFQTE